MKLWLFLYCRGSKSPAVKAFAMDHLNDVVVNTVGLGGGCWGWGWGGSVAECVWGGVGCHVGAHGWGGESLAHSPPPSPAHPPTPHPLAGALLGAKVAYYWDPIIAIVMSVWVVWAWGGHAQEHILNLVGRSAPPDLLQRLTYLTYFHDPRVQYIDTVR